MINIIWLKKKLKKKIISESPELFGEDFDDRNYRLEYGLDNLRDYLMQLYIEKSGEFLK